MTTEQLKALRAATNEIIAELKALPTREKPEGAINWARVRCSQAEYSIDDDGDKRYTVFIDDADTSACQLHDRLSSLLKEAGFPSVRVLLEW